MKNKDQVYVVVHTGKQAKKLKEVLDMFREDVYRNTYDRLQKGIVCNYYTRVHYNINNWCGGEKTGKTANKNQVTIKELKNILAKEHLKEGDVIVCGIGDNRCIVRYEGFENNLFNGSFMDLKGTFINAIEDGGFNNFIRYATEEEKALLEPKNELQEGKWYKGINDNTQIVFKDNDVNYGFVRDSWYYNLTCNNVNEWQQATLQEVEQALIEEAKKRGLDNTFVKDINGVIISTNSGSFVYNHKDNILYKNGAVLFNDGKWADIIVNEQVVKENIKNLKQDIKGSKLDHIEQKVVDYAESVEWDFEKVMDEIEKPEKESILSYDEWCVLAGSDSYLKTENIFNKYNPHWELKQAYKDGADIEFYDIFSDKWRSISNPLWHKNDKYRIRSLQIGYWVMYYSGDIKKYTIITQGNLNHYTKNKCTRVKDKQLIDLLNNNK